MLYKHLHQIINFIVVKTYLIKCVIINSVLHSLDGTLEVILYKNIVPTGSKNTKIIDYIMICNIFVSTNDNHSKK